MQHIFGLLSAFLKAPRVFSRMFFILLLSFPQGSPAPLSYALMISRNGKTPKNSCFKVFLLSVFIFC